MNLQQMHDLAAGRSYYSRSDGEVYAALNTASKKIYLWTAREFRGYFLKIDTTTIQFAAGQEEYACPPDLRILLKFGEQPINSAAGTPYNWMTPADLNSDRFIERENDALIINVFGPASEFVYYGPFLDQASSTSADNKAQPTRTRKLLISPIPQDVRVTKLFYAAQHVEIVGPQSFLTMPEEAHDAILDYAVAELVRPNGDAMAQTYEAAGKTKFQEDFLPFMRQTQAQRVPQTQEPFIEDLD